MSRFDSWVVDGSLPDIAYLTEDQPEVVHPWVGMHEGVYCVYFKHEKAHLPLEVFFRRLAKREPKLGVRARRKNGETTSITFNRHERVTLSPRLQQVLAELAR